MYKWKFVINEVKKYSTKFDEFLVLTIGKGHFVTAYSATWKYKVTLLCFSDLQRFLDKVKEFENDSLK
ncbi:hypothetical protein RIR_jg2255.t1 [Rhizophagus irregularis DAOM 181602=DAOM 197198]|nr:hypothetical protein RIR_jg2255.t1 [Rhizophagus irregularis DAOM 181602=DAOM 197198]